MVDGRGGEHGIRDAGAKAQGDGGQGEIGELHRLELIRIGGTGEELAVESSAKASDEKADGASNQAKRDW